MELFCIAVADEEVEGADDETVPTITDTFHEFGLDAEEEDNFTDEFSDSLYSQDYAPYKNKTMCLLDILDNLPRLHLSGSQLKMIFWIMRECGARNVPSFKAFRAMQKKVRHSCGVSTDPHVSDLGNFFYINNIQELISKDFANPEIATHIQKYPEDVNGGPVSEIWQVHKGRWQKIAELQDQRWVISILWIDQHGRTHADCHAIIKSDHLLLVDPELIRISLDEFMYNHENLAIQHNSSPMEFAKDSEKFAALIPNHHCKNDNGEDFFTIWMPIWADDVSGARFKQYQKHINIYMANANLPGRLLQQEYFVHFVSTSPHASAPEQLAVVAAQVVCVSTCN
ncbi:hypothetical protein AcV5_003845 [Taiwanofungus camphoratus]|nr:hypothetical protein AcV5_003845 [Antrodia cinnamomea]KAI0919403.1 hypothetical protein AcV7_006151 [Antrodia cinnamomea]